MRLTCVCVCVQCVERQILVFTPHIYMAKRVCGGAAVVLVCCRVTPGQQHSRDSLHTPSFLTIAFCCCCCWWWYTHARVSHHKSTMDFLIFFSTQLDYYYIVSCPRSVLTASGNSTFRKVRLKRIDNLSLFLFFNLIYLNCLLEIAYIVKISKNVISNYPQSLREKVKYLYVRMYCAAHSTKHKFAVEQVLWVYHTTARWLLRRMFVLYICACDNVPHIIIQMVNFAHLLCEYNNLYLIIMGNLKAFEMRQFI